MKDQFTIQRQNGVCYIQVEGSDLRIELADPGDFQHAWRVAGFLQENVKAISESSKAPGKT